ncbi:MAG: ABC transporter ATP-binding protein [Ferruginibacter sp.]
MGNLKNGLNGFLNLVKLEQREISSIYFYAVLSGLAQLSVPVGVQAIIGFVLGASMVTSIYVLITVVVLGVLLVGLLQVNQMKIIEKIQQKIFTRNAFEFTEAIPRFDLLKTDQYYLPEKVNCFFDTLNIQKGLSKILLDVPTASIQILLGLILLSLYHPVFLIFDLVLLFILWLILRLTGKNGIQTNFEESTNKYIVVAWLEEMARVIKSFKLSHGTHLNLQKTDNKLLAYLGARTAHFRVLLFQYRTLVYFKVAITATMLIVGTHLLLTQQLNIGEFIAAEIIILTVISAVEKLISSLESVYDVITGLEKTASVTGMEKDRDGSIDLEAAHGLAVKMTDVSFAYPDEGNVLLGIHLDVPSNCKVSISGAEGSGKSTLMKLLSGNYSYFGGSILINNIPIGNYSLESLRSKTGAYLNYQDIFEGTVWENISLGRPGITAERITQIAEKTGLGSFLHTLPLGYETQTDALGKRLPANVVKKIILLRALANEPALLLMEEPWLGLDEGTRGKLMHYLLYELPLTTVFVVTNDNDFANKCHYSFSINEGKLEKK